MQDPDDKIIGDSGQHSVSAIVSTTALLAEAPDVDGSRCEPFPERLDPRMFGPMRPHQYLIGAESITRPMRRLLEAVRTRHTLSAHVTKKATHMHQRHEMQWNRSAIRRGSHSNSPSPSNSPTGREGNARRRRSSVSLDSSAAVGSRSESPSLNGPTRRLARRKSFLVNKKAVPSPSTMVASLTSALGSGSGVAAVAAAQRHRLFDDNGVILSSTAWVMRDTLSFLKTVLEDCVERALRECGQRYVNRCHDRIRALEKELHRMSRETKEREAIEEERRKERQILVQELEKREAHAAAEAAAAAEAMAAAEAAAEAAAAAAEKVADVAPAFPNTMNVQRGAVSFWATMWYTGGAVSIRAPTVEPATAEGVKAELDSEREGWDSPSAELLNILTRRRRLSESIAGGPPAGPPPPVGVAALVGLHKHE